MTRPLKKRTSGGEYTAKLGILPFLKSVCTARTNWLDEPNPLIRPCRSERLTHGMSFTILVRRLLQVARPITRGHRTTLPRNRSSYRKSGQPVVGTRDLIMYLFSFRYPTVSEVFARANSLKWFAAKRRASEAEEENDRTEKVYSKEGYAEVGRKEASLVDVDQEIDLLMS